MAHDDSPFAAARREINPGAAARAAWPAESPRESGSGVPATVGGIPIASALLLPADHLDAESAWNQHIPFAFWLVQAHRPAVFVELGTYRGTSYFSFCQAVAALRLPTRCFAIDTWQGDSHSGFYDESVFARVRTCNERKYAGFSRLVRSSFDEALPHFLDGSIDLLHIDGLHTYEACRHDFESWLPKLSRRAIVLFHDTNVRERGFGVHRLWAELIERYPHFEFVHEHGLGVLGVGEALDGPVRELFAAADNAALTCEIRSAFWRLGSTVQTQIDLNASVEQRVTLETLLSTSISQSEIEISRLTAEQAQLRLSVEEKEHQAADLTVQCAVVRREKAELGMALAAARSERAQLDTALSLARSEQAELGTGLAAARSENADLGTALAAARGENADLGTALAAARAENADLGTALAAAGGENADLGTALATARSENAELDAALAAAREEGADRRAALDAKAAELSAVRIRAERAEAVSAAARKQLDAISRSTSWRITRPLRRLDAAHSRFARQAARIVKQVRWARRLGARLHEYFALRASIKLITASTPMSAPRASILSFITYGTAPRKAGIRIHSSIPTGISTAIPTFAPPASTPSCIICGTGPPRDATRTRRSTRAAISSTIPMSALLASIRLRTICGAGRPKAAVRAHRSTATTCLRWASIPMWHLLSMCEGYLPSLAVAPETHIVTGVSI